MVDPKNARIIRVTITNPDDGKAQALLSLMGRCPVPDEIMARDIKAAMEQADFEKKYTIDHIAHILQERFAYNAIVIDVDGEVSDANVGRKAF